MIISILLRELFNSMSTKRLSRFPHHPIWKGGCMSEGGADCRQAGECLQAGAVLRVRDSDATHSALLESAGTS